MCQVFCPNYTVHCSGSKNTTGFFFNDTKMVSVILLTMKFVAAYIFSFNKSALIKRICAFIYCTRVCLFFHFVWTTGYSFSVVKCCLLAKRWKLRYLRKNGYALLLFWATNHFGGMRVVVYLICVTKLYSDIFH
jgi:hypothetical protein